jgi:hypothetical protein
MELMLWLMTRSLVGLLRCSGDFETQLSDGVVEVIFGFSLLLHFGGIQG